MISVNELYLQYSDRIIFDRITFTITDGEKIGLVGRNGAGKSTLLKTLAGEQSPDEGNIQISNSATIGYLHQDMMMPKGKTVMEEAMSAFKELQILEDELHLIQKDMEVRTDYESDSYQVMLDRFAELQDRLLYAGLDNRDEETERILKGLGFQPKDFNRQTTTFSGGWQMRVELAKMLLQKPSYLFLDEPTNHLDIESIIWLESFLKNYFGTVVLISHDQKFIDTITERTLEVELGNLYDYKAPYYRYLELREERRTKMQAAFNNQQKVIAQKEKTISRFMAKATKTKMAQSMQKQLDKIDRIELDEEDTDTMNLRFQPSPRSGQIVVSGKQISKSYDATHVLDKVDFHIERGERVAFVGQNGQGKTTLAKILINDLEASSGEVEAGHNVAIGYYAQNQAEKLDPKRTLLQTMEDFSPPEMRTKLRAILGAFMFSGEDVEKKVSVLSGGERARLALACMLLRPFNLLVMDEPTNHLDVQSKFVLKTALQNYDGTLLIVSHDRDFLEGLTDKVVEFRDKHLHTYLGDINYFLAERAVNDMREVELSSKLKATSAVEVAPKEDLDFETRKRLQRQVGNAERKIETIEAQIATLEKKMADPSFFQQADAQKITDEHKAFQAALEEAMEEWELAAVELGD